MKTKMIKDLVLSYMKKHPNASLAETAQACNTSTAYVSVVKKKQREQAEVAAYWEKLNDSSAEKPAEKEAEKPAEKPAPVTQETVDAILDGRNGIYGSYANVARTSQMLKHFFRSTLAGNGLSLREEQAESLDMIANKLSRILNGDPHYVDSWTDIAGYATLVTRALTKT